MCPAAADLQRRRGNRATGQPGNRGNRGCWRWAIVGPPQRSRNYSLASRLVTARNGRNGRISAAAQQPTALRNNQLLRHGTATVGGS